MKQSIVVLLSLFLVLPLSGADFSTTNLQLLKGSDYKLGAKERNIITVEHFSAYGAGDLFFFFDAEQAFNLDSSLYGEITANWSSRKLLMGGGEYSSFFKDISLATSLELSGSGARLLGVTFDLGVPGFQVFRLIAFHRNKKLESDTSYQLTWVWALPFSLGPTKWLFEGFLDYAGKEGTTAKMMITQPRLLFDLMHLVNGKSDLLLIGTEYSKIQNKFGVDGTDEDLWQMMVKWVL